MKKLPTKFRLSLMPQKFFIRKLYYYLISIVLRQHKLPLISQEISVFSLFSELFEDTFSGVWWADPNGDPYGSGSGFWYDF